MSATFPASPSQDNASRQALLMSAIAFTICFAVWTIFSIIGVRIKEELGLSETEFGLLVGTPILTGSLVRIVLSPQDRRALLSGRAPVPMPAVGRIVCSCFNIGVNQIAAAAAQGCDGIEAIGQALRAGTNCGSCRSEMRTIIHSHGARLKKAAE